jgi:hypothetical protein
MGTGYLLGSTSPLPITTPSILISAMLSGWCDLLVGVECNLVELHVGGELKAPTSAKSADLT